MSRGLRLGTVRGIEIRLDWSLAIIFFLVAFSLGLGLLPAWYPDWSAAMAWLVALVAASLLLASVLVHELSHALVGKALGVEVRRITLFVFGGMAQIERELRLPVFGSGPLGGMWIALIGWFLHNAAILSYRQLLARRSLAGVPVSQVMVVEPATVSADTAVVSLVDDYLIPGRQGSFPVVEGERLVGLVGLDNLRKIEPAARARRTVARSRRRSTSSPRCRSTRPPPTRCRRSRRAGSIRCRWWRGGACADWSAARTS